MFFLVAAILLATAPLVKAETPNEVNESKLSLTLNWRVVKYDGYKFNHIIPKVRSTADNNSDNVPDVSLGRSSSHTNANTPTIQRLGHKTKTNVSVKIGNAKRLYRSSLGYNCVDFAFSKGLRARSFGYAKNIPVNSSQPQEGSFVIFKGSKQSRGMGHVAWVKSVAGDYITIQESSYFDGWISERTISWRQMIIKGFVI